MFQGSLPHVWYIRTYMCVYCTYVSVYTHVYIHYTDSYQNGMMSVKEGLSEEANLVIHKATEQVITISDQKGPDCIEDRDIDALLSWTDGLNFDQ